MNKEKWIGKSGEKWISKGRKLREEVFRTSSHRRTRRRSVRCSLRHASDATVDNSKDRRLEIQMSLGAEICRNSGRCTSIRIHVGPGGGTFVRAIRLSKWPGQSALQMATIAIQSRSTLVEGCKVDGYEGRRTRTRARFRHGEREKERERERESCFEPRLPATSFECSCDTINQ